MTSAMSAREGRLGGAVTREGEEGVRKSLRDRVAGARRRGEIQEKLSICQTQVRSEAGGFTLLIRTSLEAAWKDVGG